MASRRANIEQRIYMIRKILHGLTDEQATQSHDVLLRMTDLELRAVYARRRSYVLGAPTEKG